MISVWACSHIFIKTKRYPLILSMQKGLSSPPTVQGLPSDGDFCNPATRLTAILNNHGGCTSKVWLVTGSGSGLGRNIAEAVLASGDRLVATARDPRRLEDLLEKYGDQVRAAPLDVTDEKAAQASMQLAVDVFGHLDVVVNNAGYGDIAPFEQLSSERFKALMDTNFYGVVNVTRAALPIMRKQRSGYIFQISSVGGRLARPGSAGYHAAKWAVGGFTESLAQEVAPFGVKVCALEPGGMRTNWGVRANKETPVLLSDYEPSVGAV